MDNVAAALQGANKPNRHDEPCQKGGDDRSSDLCAQWKAADAARDAADYTDFFGWLGTVIGVLTLAAAGAAAYFAKKAADHTETGAKAAQDQLAVARHAQAQELRPYLFIDTIELDKDESTEQLFKLKIVFKNYGNIPARSIYVRADAYFANQPDELRKNVLTIAKVPLSPCAPGDTSPYFKVAYLSEKNRKLWDDRELVLIIRVRYWYRGPRMFAERGDYFHDALSIRGDSAWRISWDWRERYERRVADLLKLMQEDKEA